jgi:diguanylate cyclase (GGDEF)-like protein/PAS domain S-box-containing protein
VLTHASLVTHHAQIFWTMIAVGVVAGVRQLVVVADHVSLTRDLHSAVQRRTAQARHREQWWRDLVQNLTNVVIVVAADGTVDYCSPSIEAALGHWPKHLGTEDGLRSQVHVDDLPAVDASIGAVLAGEIDHGRVEARIVTAGGTYRWFDITAVGQVSDSALQGKVLTLHDVTERHELTELLSHQAHHDSLTGLPNRTLLMQRLDEALDRDREFSLLLIDLDDFKLINDSYGHGAGDVVLAAVGKRLSGTIRAVDTVARLGGDEFAVLVHGSPERAESVAQRIKERLNKPVAVDGRRFHVSSSIGVVFADPSDDDAQALLSYADIALYQAKAQDKGAIVVVATDQRGDVARQVHLREHIARPDLKQFSVVYQPIVDLQSGRLRGLEALLRWTHPEHGPIPPSDFIPLAEHGGSIGVLGRFVLETAVAQLGAWQREVPDHRLAIGVNVSVLQLDEPDFAEHVLRLIGEQSLAPDQLVIEVTEQSLAKDFETAVSVVAELRRRGVSVAVDDYGTGYSSLRYLHRFDADVVKIDRSFIANLHGNTHTQTIVQSVIHMAEALDIQCIAEGIETVEQLELVRSLRCELGQGYLFSRPLAPDDALSFIKDGEALEAAMRQVQTV